MVSKSVNEVIDGVIKWPFCCSEPEPEVPDEVQDSPVPSQSDPTPNSAEGESSQAPSAAPPVAALVDANIMMFSLLKQMTDLVGTLTTIKA